MGKNMKDVLALKELQEQLKMKIRPAADAERWDWGVQGGESVEGNDK